MITSAARLQVECRSNGLDQAMLTQQVIQCAYDIAKAAKLVVTTYNAPWLNALNFTKTSAEFYQEL